MITQHYTKKRAKEHLDIIEKLMDGLNKYDCCSINNCPMLIANDNKYNWHCYDCYNIFYPEYNLKYIGRRYLVKNKKIPFCLLRKSKTTFCPCVTAHNNPEILPKQIVIDILIEYAKRLLVIAEEIKEK